MPAYEYYAVIRVQYCPTSPIPPYESYVVVRVLCHPTRPMRSNEFYMRSYESWRAYESYAVVRALYAVLWVLCGPSSPCGLTCLLIPDAMGMKRLSINIQSVHVWCDVKCQFIALYWSDSIYCRAVNEMQTSGAGVAMALFTLQLCPLQTVPLTIAAQQTHLITCRYEHSIHIQLKKVNTALDEIAVTWKESTNILLLYNSNNK